MALGIIMEQLGVGVERGDLERATFEKRKRDFVFWGGSALLAGYALLQLLLVEMYQPYLGSYAILPNPYFLLLTPALVAGFFYVNLYFIKHRLQGGKIKLSVILLVMVALSLAAAQAVRELGYRIPGVSIAGADQELYRAGIDTYLRLKRTNPWCAENPEECVNQVQVYFAKPIAEDLIRRHFMPYCVVEGLAMSAMVAAFIGLHRLIMSGRLGQSRYHYIRLFNRYGAAP